jgi:hypothetical protein
LVDICTGNDRPVEEIWMICGFTKLHNHVLQILAAGEFP